jgi:hypothetical protein
MLSLRFVLVISLLSPGLVFASGAVHKWYDEDGNAVYSQFAPPDGKQAELVKPPPPPAEDPATAQSRLQDQLQRSADYREDKELAAEKAAEAQAATDKSRERCAQAREAMVLLNGPARQLFQLPDGTVQRLSEEERQARREQTQQVIDESCQ